MSAAFFQTATVHQTPSLHRSPTSRWLAQAEQLFAAAARLGHDGVGITRESYGKGETAVLAMLREWAAICGLARATDHAANGLFSQRATRDRPRIVCGSHIDSVPHGGNFDGLAGVIAGLLVLDRLENEGVHVPMTVAAIRGEESAWYGKAYVGSSAALGTLKFEDLALRNVRSGRTLRDALGASGADLGAIERGYRAPWTQADAYLELHIEQGPVMVAQGWPTAIVSGIRGNVRHNRIVCIGEAGHSGAIPRDLRKDAVLAVADLLMRMDRHWADLLAAGEDLVVTSGIVTTDAHEHAVSRIPGEAEFSFEARSQRPETLERVHALLVAEIDAVARERGVRFELDRKIVSPPAHMDPGLMRVLQEAADAAGQPCPALPSGAGHDAAQFANAGVPAAMLFVRNAHGSHNPNEAMDLADFVAAVEVLYHAVRRLA
jgi:N-carbamoyl-L-amino-acid hydrolase